MLQALKRATEFVRVEEWVLAALVALSIVGCMASGTGFSPRGPAVTYATFFAPYYMLVFLATRFLYQAGRRWSPSGRAGRWLKAHVAPYASSDEVLAPDHELARGGLLFIVALATYTNVKVRIPLINDQVGDEVFAEMDRLLFGQDFTWLGRLVVESPMVDEILQRIYLHDYIFLAVVALLFHLKRDSLGMRWLFAALALVSLIGIWCTVAWPSYGPFIDSEQWSFMAHHQMSQFQASLMRAMYHTLEAARAGRELRVHAFSGVAAFPSMHVGQMTVVATVCLLRPGVRWFGWVLIAGILATTVATVAYGWHYFVCTPGGILVAIVAVRAAKALIDVDERRRARRGQAATDAAA